jgi:hypothetical protein
MKFCILCIAAALLSLNIAAQSIGVTTYNSTTLYPQGFSRVIQTSDGGFLTLASTGINGRICKMNANYVVQWAIQMDSLPFQDAVETNDGNYVVQGISYKTDFASSGVHVIKLTPTGTIVYEKFFYDPSFATPVSASGIAKGAGTDNGFVLYGGNCIAMQYLLKCDASGTIQWQYSYAGAFGAGCIMSVVSESTGYACALITTVSTVPSVGILKVDASGTPVAARTMASTNGQTLFSKSLVKLNNGDYFLWAAPYDIYGAQNYTISNSLSSITCNRISNTSIEVTGVFATANTNDDVMLTFIGYNTYYGGFLKVTPAGGMVVQKYSSNLTNMVSPSNGLTLHNGTYLINGTVNNNRGLFAVVDESGAGFCSSNDPGCTMIPNYSITTGTPTVNPVAIGIAASYVTYPFSTIVYSTVNVCGTLIGVPENEAASNATIFPNPFSDKITISREENDIVTLNVINIHGQIVLSKQVSGNTIEVETSSLSNGVYMVQLVSENGTKVFRVVKD